MLSRKLNSPFQVCHTYRAISPAAPQDPRTEVIARRREVDGKACDFESQWARQGPQIIKFHTGIHNSSE